MDKYKANFFDDKFKLNWKKFLLDEENFEKKLIYNDNAKQVLRKTYLIKDFYMCMSIKNGKEIKNADKDIENESNQRKENKEKVSKIDDSNSQINTSAEYFKSDYSMNNQFIEN